VSAEQPKPRKGPKPRPLADRFWEKVDKSGDCWLWTAACYPNGYGLFNIRNRSTALAHRVAYELSVGPIPEGLVIDHLCRNVRCVNPAHLEPVTMRENLLRGEGPSARAAKATHCPKGHPYSGSNLYVKPNGHRECRACHREIERARRRRAVAG